MSTALPSSGASQLNTGLPAHYHAFDLASDLVAERGARFGIYVFRRDHPLPVAGLSGCDTPRSRRRASLASPHVRTRWRLAVLSWLSARYQIVRTLSPDFELTPPLLATSSSVI